MDYESAISILKKSGDGHYTITFKDGEKTTKRLFYNGNYNVIAEYAKNRRKFGYPLNESFFSRAIQMYKVLSKDRKQPSFEAFRRNFAKIYALLSKSGMWPDKLSSARNFLRLTENEQKSLFSLVCNHGPGYAGFPDWYEKIKGQMKDIGIEMSVDLLESLTRPSGIKAINYIKTGSSRPNNPQNYMGKPEVIQAIQDARAGECRPGRYGEPYYFRYDWNKGYDNSITIQREKDGTVYGWYSEEYKDCSNGYYWILLDESFAMFCEKD